MVTSSLVTSHHQVTAPLPKLSRGDEAVAVLIKHSEGFPDLFLRISIFHFTRHHSEELREIDSSVTCKTKNYVIKHY